ncbi:MAG: hypothetical protein IJG41_02550 [Bacteroidales bacterium]|nr:hypothetical protein [Bacteroidales bacterium]
MKTTKSLKTVAFALGLAAMGLTAGNLNAQTGGGLLGKGAETEAGASNGIFLSATDASNGLFMRGTGGNSTGFNIFVEQFGGENGGGQGGFNIVTEQFGDAPLGSGLFIMAAAGAAYAFSKKRKKQENK